MSEHAHQLYAVEFTEAEQSRLDALSCGDATWARAAVEWIRGSDVLDSMNRNGTRVWLFETAEGDVVGFGSVGTSRWRWPLPDGDYATIVLLPMLGVDIRFQGQPSDPQWRYSRQIMSHLLHEAQQIASEWTGTPSKKPRWFVLMVHPDNRRAIRFYELCGFELISGVQRNHDHLVMKYLLGN